MNTAKKKDGDECAETINYTKNKSATLLINVFGFFKDDSRIHINNKYSTHLIKKLQN